MGKIIELPAGEHIVSLIEFQGRLWVATQRRIFVRNDETGEFEAQTFVRLDDEV